MNITKEQLNQIFTPGLTKIFETFESYGFEIRVVGGAIRDSFMGAAIRDVDLAVNATPTEIIYVLDELAETREAVVVPGIRHGTAIIALDENEQYEVTALDFNITSENGKLVISQNADWESDAKRRDFTVNSMSMDKTGKVYDFVGGEQDIKNQKVEFVDDYKKQITNNPIMILRFFKLLGKFKSPKYDKNVISFIKENVELLKDIRSDALKWFLVNIKNQEYGERSMKLMEEAGIEVSELVETTSLLNLYLKKIYY